MFTLIDSMGRKPSDVVTNSIPTWPMNVHPGRVAANVVEGEVLERRKKLNIIVWGGGYRSQLW